MAYAAPLYWDGTDTSADADGGDGTWDNVTLNWDDAAAGGNSVVWTDGEDAVFGGAAGTVTVSGVHQVNQITISAGYSFTGGVTDSLNVGGATIDSSALGTGGSTDVSMNTVLSGTGGLIINAHGNLTAGGGGSGAEFILGNGNGNGNTFSGGLQITSGIVSWIDDSSFGNAANTITLKNDGGLLATTSSKSLDRDVIVDSTGGTIRTYGSTTLTLNGKLSGIGDLNRTDGGLLVLTNSSNDISGDINLQGGNLRVTGAGSMGTATINNGTALEFFNDGTAGTYSNTITGSGTVRFESATGTTYDGSLTTTGTVQVGDVTDGAKVTFADGAVLNVANLWLGESYYKDATVTQQDGSDVTVTNELRVAHWPGETSTYNMEGGTLTLTGTPHATNTITAGVVMLGKDGTGIFNQTGGTVSASGVGLDTSGNTTGTDQYNLNGGTLILKGRGIYGQSSSEFNMGGGTLQASGDFGSTKDWNITANSSFNSDGHTVTQKENIIGSSNLDLTGTLTLDTTGAKTVSANLTGTGGVTKSNTGTYEFSGANTYTGATAVSAGTLVVSGSLGNTAVSVADGAGIGGDGSIGGSLTLGVTTGSQLLVDPTASSQLDVAGDVTLNGVTTLVLSEAPSAGSTTNVLSYGGTLNDSNGGTLTDSFTIANQANYRTFDVTDSAQTLILDLGIEDHKWVGGSSANWSPAGDTNWSSSDNQFFDGDYVTFDDTASGNFNVQITGDVAPAAVTFNNSANDYTLTSNGGVITGETGLVKDGSGMLTINSQNTFTGDTVINQGTVKFASGRAFGSYRAGRPVDQVTINAGGAVDLNGVGDATYGYTIAGTGVGGTGAITNTGGNIGNGLAQTSNITLAADASIGGTGNWALLTNGYGATTLDLDGHTLTKTGSNEFTIANTTVTAGNIQVDSGSMRVFRTSNASAASLNLADTSGVALNLSNNFSVGSLSGGGANGGNVNLGSQTLTVGALNTSTTFSGLLTGTGKLTKTGTGTLTLAGNNTHTGTLTINEGTLSLSGVNNYGRVSSAGTSMPTRLLDGSGTLRADNGSDVTLRRSSADFTGAVEVASGGTLTLGHTDATGTAAVSLQGGTLAFDNSGSYFTALSGETLTGGSLTTDVTTNDYSTMHNTSGDVVPGSTTHAYHGQIYLTAGDWSFSKNFDDGGSVTIDGTEVINNNTWNAVATGTFTAATDGWYTIDARVAQGGGGVGPVSWTKGIGIKQGSATTNNADYEAFGDGVLGTRLVTNNDVTFTQTINLTGTSTIDTSGMVGDTTTSGADGNGDGGDVILSGGLSGTGGFAKAGAGTLSLTSNSSYEGHTTVNGGMLKVSATLRNTSGITVNAGVTLETGATNMFVGGHGVAVADSRVITVNNGTWLMNSSMNSRIGNVTLNDGATWTSNRAVSGYDVLLANTSAGAATVTVSGSGASTMNGSGGIHLQGVQNFSVADTTGDAGADLNVSMVLANPGISGGAAGGINKTGAGTMELNSINSYTGKTTVAEGMLSLGVSGSIAHSVEIEVASGAQFDVSGLSTTFELQDGQTLGGAGQVLGPIELAQGSVLAPGSSAGTLTMNSSLMLGTGSFLDFELSGSDQTTGSNINDLVVGITDLTLDGTLNVTELVTNDFLNAQSGDRWVLMEYSGGLTDNGLDLGTLPTLTAGLDFELDITTGGQVALTVIPEPSTFTLFGLGAFALILRRKR